MCYLENYKIKDYYKVVYTNLEAIPSTVVLRKTMVLNPKGWRRYRVACRNKLHDIGKSVYYKDTIYVASKIKNLDDTNIKYVLKGIKNCLNKLWDKPVVIPVFFYKDMDKFKEKILSYNKYNNQIIFTDEI